MKGLVTFFLTWLVVVVVMEEAEGQTTTQGPKKPVPDDNLFKDPHAFCEGCYGMVYEADQLLTKWNKDPGSLEHHIDAALLAVCSTDRLRAYVLSPPKMLRLCSGIRAHYEDELGLALLRYYSSKTLSGVESLFESVCRKAIPACPTSVNPMSVVRKEKMEKAEEEKKAKEQLEKKEKTKEKSKKSKEGKKDKGKRGEKKKENATKKDEL